MTMLRQAAAAALTTFALLASAAAPTAAQAKTQSGGCDPAAVFSMMRAATGGSHWKAAREITAFGSAKISGLRGTGRLDDDLSRGRYAQRFDVDVQGASAQVYDGTTTWSQDISGGVHALDAAFPRERSVTNAYLARRGYFDPSAHATFACRGTRTQDGKPVVVVRVVPRNGIPADLAIDRVSHLLASVTEVLPIATSVVRYADYRPASGLVLPFSISSGTLSEPADGFTVHVTRYAVREQTNDADFARPATVNGAVMLEHRASSTVPITLEAQQLILWASIDGHAPLPFILDTGGHAILTTGAARALGLHGSGSGESGGSGSGTIALQYTKVDRVRIGAAELRNQKFLIIPYPYSFYERGRKTPLAGIIGLEFFERYATRIDYAARTVTFTPLGTFHYRGAGTAVPLRFQDDMPMAVGAADGYRGLFGIDTGNSGSVILFGDYLRRNGFFKRYATGYAIQGHGTGGSNTGRVQTLREIGVGGHDVRNLPAVFTQMHSGAFSSWTEAGNIGYTVLSRFVATFDYANETLHLEPNPNAKPLAKNRAGMRITKETADAITVTTVQPGSPAASAGIVPGDSITNVNGAGAAAYSRSDFYELITGPAGARLRIRVQHARSARDVMLVLR